MELGSGSSAWHNPEKSYFGDRVQGLQTARIQRRAAVHHQKRQDRPPGNPQRISAQEDSEGQILEPHSASGVRIHTFANSKEILLRADEDVSSGDRGRSYDLLLQITLSDRFESA